MTTHPRIDFDPRPPLFPPPELPKGRTSRPVDYDDLQRAKLFQKRAEQFRDSIGDICTEDLSEGSIFRDAEIGFEAFDRIVTKLEAALEEHYEREGNRCWS